MGNSESSQVINLGRRIAQARVEADMTQAELGRAIGLDRTAVAKLEAGARKVSATELVSIASALDRPIDRCRKPPLRRVGRRPLPRT